MSLNNCCLCLAVTGDERPGRIPEGWGFAVCDEHRARSVERSRNASSPVLKIPETPEEAFIHAGVMAALGLGPSVSLAAIGQTPIGSKAGH